MNEKQTPQRVVIDGATYVKVPNGLSLVRANKFASSVIKYVTAKIFFLFFYTIFLSFSLAYSRKKRESINKRLKVQKKKTTYCLFFNKYGT